MILTPHAADTLCLDLVEGAADTLCVDPQAADQRCADPLCARPGWAELLNRRSVVIRDQP